MRTGADDAHVAAQHVEQLRQLVDARGAHDAPNAGDARIAARRRAMTGQITQIRMHAAEFEDVEQAIAAAHARLTEEDRPPAVELDRDRDRQKQRPDEGDRGADDGEIEAALEDPIARVERTERDDQRRMVGEARDAYCVQRLQFGHDDLALHIGPLQHRSPGIAALGRTGDDDPLGALDQRAEAIEAVWLAGIGTDLQHGGIEHDRARRRRHRDLVGDHQRRDRIPIGPTHRISVQQGARDRHQHDREQAAARHDDPRHLGAGVQEEGGEQHRQRRRADRSRGIIGAALPAREEARGIEPAVGGDREIGRQQDDQRIEPPMRQRIAEAQQVGDQECAGDRAAIQREQADVEPQPELPLAAKLHRRIERAVGVRQAGPRGRFDRHAPCVASRSRV